MGERMSVEALVAEKLTPVDGGDVLYVSIRELESIVASWQGMARLLGDDTEADPWKADAACQADDVNPDWFFPDSSRPAVRYTRFARGVCAGCPVRVPCLDLALRRGGDGIYAGTTLAQRRAVRNLGHEQAMVVLLEQAKEATTTGRWRSSSPDEWEEQAVERAG